MIRFTSETIQYICDTIHMKSESNMHVSRSCESIQDSMIRFIWSL